MADLNDFVEDRWQSVFLDFIGTEKETHYDKRCCYEKLPNAIIIHGTKVYIIVRICYCGRGDRSEYKHKKVINISEFRDGVEIHLNPNCCYTKKRIHDRFILERINYCPH